MPSVTQWALGMAVGFLILQLGNFVVPTLSPMAAFIVVAILFTIAVMLGWRVSHRGD